MTPAPPPHRRYGLDIETDTSLDGLDATRAAIVAVAVSTTRGDQVLLGDETDILRRLDALLAALEPGVIITWNGTHFDLPFIATRAALLHVSTGLRLGEPVLWPPPRRPGPYACSWGRHRHLDGYRLYRDDFGRTLHVSCGLKPLSRLAGLAPVEVDRSQIHRLSDEQMREYVASDARLARQLVDRRMPVAYASADRAVPPPVPPHPAAPRGAEPGPSPSPLSPTAATLA